MRVPSNTTNNSNQPKTKGTEFEESDDMLSNIQEKENLINDNNSNKNKNKNKNTMSEISESINSRFKIRNWKVQRSEALVYTCLYCLNDILSVFLMGITCREIAMENVTQTITQSGPINVTQLHESQSSFWVHGYAGDTQCYGGVWIVSLIGL